MMHYVAPRWAECAVRAVTKVVEVCLGGNVENSGKIARFQCNFKIQIHGVGRYSWCESRRNA